MSKCILLLCAGLLLCVAASSVFAAKGGAKQDRPQPVVVDIAGTLKSVAPSTGGKTVGTIVVSVVTDARDSGSAADATILVTASTKIMIGGEAKALKDLMVKKPIKVNLRRTPDGVNTALGIAQDK